MVKHLDTGTDMALKKRDREYVQATVDSEGFDYAFTHYTDFEEIKDEEFHRLRVAYNEARKALVEYAEIGDE